jgi:hypothetical protein
MQTKSQTDAFVINWWKLLVKKRKFMYAGMLFGLLIGFFLALFLKPKYEAKLSFIINDSKNSSGNYLSSITSQLGILGVNAMNVTDDRILFLSNSRKICGQALLDSLPGKQLIADEFIAYHKLNKLFEKTPEMQGFNGFIHSELELLNYQENFAINAILEIITKPNYLQVESVKKKATTFVGNTSSGIIELTFKHKVEALASAFLAAMYHELTKFYLKAMTNQQQELVDLIEYKVDSVEQLVSDLDKSKARAIDESIGMVRVSGRINETQLRRSGEILNSLYAELLKNREVARFNLNQQKPVFELVDFPRFPLKKIEYSLVLFPIISSLIALFTAVMGFTIWLVFKYKSDATSN